MSENNARASGVFASSDTRQPGDDGESSTDDGDVTPTPDSDGESTGFSDQLFLDTVVNRTSSGTETDASQRATLPASSVSRVTRQKPDSSSSSGESCRGRGARGQQFVAYQLTESHAKILKLENVQKKVTEELLVGSRGTCFKFDKRDKTTFLVRQAFVAQLDKILNQKIQTVQFDVRDGDDVELEIISSLNTEELQHEMVMDFDDETLTLMYHKTTESKISESLKRLRTPQKEIQLSSAVRRLLEVPENLQRVIEAFHYNLGFQVHMEFCKYGKNGPVLRVTCNRADSQAAFPKAEQYIASVEQSDLKISLAKGLYLQSLPGQRELQAIARRHHCIVTVETPAQRVLLRASHRNDVLLVYEGNLAWCCPQVFILPLCEGQTEWPPLYKHIMKRALLSSDAGKYTGLFGQPSTPWIHPITYGSGSNKRTIIIMYVPKLTDEGDFQRQLQDSCKAAMRSAVDVFPEAEIVLPITLGDSVPLKCSALPLMMAVRETIQENVGSALYVKLFFDKSHQNVPEIVAHMEKRLIGFGWSLDKYLENAKKVTPASSKDRGDVDSATVRLVGLRQDVTKATNEVSTIDIPPEYEVRAEEFKTISSQTGADSSSKVIQRRTIPKSEASTSASPVQQGLQEADTDVGSNQQGSEKRGSMQTSVRPSKAHYIPMPQHQACGTKGGVLMLKVDSSAVEALKKLMKKDFSQVQVYRTTSDQVTLRCSAQDTMHKIASLMREEVQLGPEDMQKISAPIDTREEGVAAYMVPVPQQGKVIIFSFDYNHVSKAKHLLNVKLGKVKLTVRSRRRFDSTNDTGGDEASSHLLGHKSSTANAAEFNTKSGIKVSVYKTDITKLPVDAIVNTANENLAHEGGVAYAISRAAGLELEDDGQKYIRKHGPLKVKAVVVTSAGSLPCEKVLHAVGPRWSDYKDKALCQEHLVDTVYNCLHKANTMQLASLAIPSISAAIFGVPKEVCAVSYLSAVQSFDKDCGRDSSVRHVHFVDVNDDMLNTVQETFKQHWNTDMSSKRQEVGKRNAPPVAQQDRVMFNKNDSGGESASSHSPPSSLAQKSSTANAAEFNTRSGIKVAVYKTDITKLPVDAIVNTANTNLAHGGGVAYAIATAAGFKLQDESQVYLSKYGRLKVREVVVTTAGWLPCKKVLHAVGPRWHDYKDKALCQQHLVDTVYNCLHKADTMRLTSLAIPSIGAAIFGVPKEVCAVSYLSAVQSFDKDCGRDTSLRHVHFVDVNDDMINTVQETFKQHWNTDMSSKRQEVGKGSAPPVAQEDRVMFNKNDSGGESASSHSPPSSLAQKSSTANAAEFNTRSGIKVAVYKTDITKLPVDAIVNTANENLAHGGGVASAIATAAGFELEDKGQEYLLKYGRLKVREVVVTTAGSLLCKKVLHAVGPRWHDYKDKALCQQHLVDTVYNCLHKADTMQLTSLAIPSIGAGIFGVPKEICAVSYLSAVQSFDKDCGRDTSLRHVHFVDVNNDMINTVHETFKQNWNTDMSSKRQEVGKGSAPAAAQQGLMSNTGSHSIRNSGSRLTPSEFGDGLSSVGKNTLHPEEKTESMRLDVHTNNRGEIEYRYYFQDLALLFKCQNVTEPCTDILVLWQEIGNLAKDENFRQYKATLSTTAQDILSRSTSNMTPAGYVYHIELDARVVLFPVVSSYSALTADKVQEMVASCLDKVGWFHKASVAIPTYPRTLKDSKEPKLAVTNFVVGLFKAVKNFSKTLTSVKQIHVISPDNETIQFITKTVSQRLAIIKPLHNIQPSVSGSGQAEPVTEDCVICHYAIKEPKALKCGHTFCTECVVKWLCEKSCCPTCKRVHGTLIGNQPSNGRMEMMFSKTAVSGYEECGSLVINYKFNGGMQTDKHPHPGKRYRGTSRTAYLPNTREGRTVLMLLKTAFDRSLIFTVGQSSTVHDYEGITWNDIHHKTATSGGATEHGYPDPRYLTRVTKELADNGVTEEDLTDTQKDFIKKPENYIGRVDFLDFSYHFK